MILAALIILAAAAVFFEIYREVHHFRITRYEIKSSRLSGLRRETKILFLSDLHNRVYGYGNRDLLQAVLQPLILSGSFRLSAVFSM